MKPRHSQNRSKRVFYLVILIFFALAIILTANFILFTYHDKREDEPIDLSQIDVNKPIEKPLIDDTPKVQLPPPTTIAVVPPTTTASSQSPPPPRLNKFMHILIPTVSRDLLPKGVDYLTPTITQLMQQLQGGNGDALAAPYNVEVSLINHNVEGKAHNAFEDLKAKYTSGEINFVSSKPSSRETKEFRLYQQTVDFLWSIKYIHSINSAKYILLMEDDFTICDHAMMAMQYLIAKANDYYPNWISLRVSYGLNGVLLKASDLPSVIEYYESQVEQGKRLSRPPDHMIFFFAEEQRKKNPTRELIAFRYNLFSHIGDVSTFTGRAKRYNPNCYQVLYDWLQEGERFHNEICPENDISPCSGPPAAQTKWKKLIDWDSDATQMLQTNSAHFPLCGPGITTEERALARKCRLKR